MKLQDLAEGMQRSVTMMDCNDRTISAGPRGHPRLGEDLVETFCQTLA